MERRRRIVIEPGFQLRLALGATAAAVVLINLVLLAGFLPGEALGIGRLSLTGAILVALLEALLLALVWRSTLHTSHRIAGPDYRVREALAALADGDLSTRVHLRRHDYFKDLAQAVNRLAEIRGGQLERLRGILAELEAQPGADAVARLRAELDAMAGGRVSGDAGDRA